MKFTIMRDVEAIGVGVGVGVGVDDDDEWGVVTLILWSIITQIGPSHFNGETPRNDIFSISGFDRVRGRVIHA